MTTPTGPPAGRDSARAPDAARPRITADDLDPLVQKLKLLEFGLYGLQEAARLAPLAPDDLGPFVRLAEEIGSEVESLRGRLETAGPPLTT